MADQYYSCSSMHDCMRLQLIAIDCGATGPRRPRSSVTCRSQSRRRIGMGDEESLAADAAEGEEEDASTLVANSQTEVEL